MVARSSAAQHTADDELFIERVFDAPPRLVFKAWTSAEYQMHWLGPKDFTVEFCEIDFCVGGKYRARIRSPEGRDHTMYGVYREIAAPERLVFTFAWEEEGERGLETLVTIDFIDQGNKTLMSFHQAPFQSLAERDGHNGGWTQCFDRLAAYLVATA
jgi:uncharacterized protein YndB with AHSA1/START domain